MISVGLGVRSGLATLARLSLGTLTEVRTTVPAMALTFDDGPDPKVTPALLDILGEHGAKGTFFVVGQAALRCPDLVERMVREGHAVGGHTLDHVALPGLSARACLWQIRQGVAMLPEGATELFRPPWGRQSPRTRMLTALARQEVVAWSHDPQDYSDATDREICDRLVEQVAPGAIVLLHDARFGRPDLDQRKTLRAVDDALGRIGNDLRFVTVPELLLLGEPVRVNWYR